MNTTRVNKNKRKPAFKRKNPYGMTPAPKRQQLSLTQQAQTRRIAQKVIAANTDYRICDSVGGASGTLDWVGQTFNLLGNLTRGDNDKDQFEGNTIFPKYLDLRYEVKSNTSSVVSISHTIRVIIGQLLEGAAVPAVTDVVENTGSVYAPLSNKNNVYSPTFNILYDQLHSIQGYSNAEESVRVFIPEWKLNKVKFVAASTTVLSGGLFLFAISGDTAASTNKPTLQYYSRVMFS